MHWPPTHMSQTALLSSWDKQGLGPDQQKWDIQPIEKNKMNILPPGKKKKVIPLRVAEESQRQLILQHKANMFPLLMFFFFVHIHPQEHCLLAWRVHDKELRWTLSNHTELTAGASHVLHSLEHIVH